jgi:hypothetical protein
MAAVLVATAGDRKIYYVIDSKDPLKDGIVETPDGSTREVPFFSYIGKTTNLKPMLSTVFHEFLWDEPSENDKKKWMETFILKIEDIDKNMMDGVSIQDSVGKARKKKTKIDTKASAFINGGSIGNSSGLQFSTKMILSDSKRKQ